jgi:hypothetical protein
MGRGWAKRSSSEDRRRQTPAQRYLGLQRLLCLRLNLNDATDVVTDGGCGIALVSWMSFVHPSIHPSSNQPPCTSKQRLSVVTNFFFQKKICKIFHYFKNKSLIFIFLILKISMFLLHLDSSKVARI